MASESLYRKWRSQTFTELVGLEAVVRTLQNALKEGRLAHAYLFTGPRGTGKTTMARLLAKTINCLNPINDGPCNTCQQCIEITAGNSFNVIEIDAASNRGIDSIRELREKVMMPPSTGKYKVYILDEAHMLTTEAFNALLKTLEEPPPHAIFVMATTDVHKMLPTVLSRCQRFDFKRYSMRQIVGHLSFVAKEEHIELQKGAAELLARAASGGMRDALSLLDQAIAYCGPEISLEQIQAMLGVADPRSIQTFLLHIGNLDSASGLHLIHELAESGADLRQVNTQIAEYLRAMMLCKAGANISEILESTEDEQREIAEAAKLFTLEELTECARIFAQNDLMQKNQGTPQLGLELALLSAIELHRHSRSGQPDLVDYPAQSVRSKSSAPPAVLPTPAQPHPSIAREQAQETYVSGYEQREPISSPSFPAAPPKTPMPQPPSRPELPDWDEIPYSSYEDEPPARPDPAPSAILPVPVVAMNSGNTAASNRPSRLTIEQVRSKWDFILRRVGTRKDGSKVAAVLKSYSLIDVDDTGDLPVVVLKASSPFHFNTIQNGGHQPSIEWAIKIEVGQECRVRLLPPNASTPPRAPGGPTRQSGASQSVVQHESSTPSNTQLSSPSPVPPTSPNGGYPSQNGTTDSSARASNSAASLSTTRLSGVEPDRPRLAETSEPKPSVTRLASSAPSTSPSPLARSSVVRENSDEGLAAMNGRGQQSSQGTRLETVKRKAKSDPVVLEVVRMFKADIKDIHLK